MLERTTVSGEDLPKRLSDIISRPNVSEAVILSTCNRTEVYAYAERFHGAYQDIRNFISEASGLAPETFSDHLYAHYDDDAVRHLFEVSAGVRSAVVGETEILGQVRTAWESAMAESASAGALNLLFRQALEVGKLARTNTGISRSITSASQAAVAMAADRLGSLEGKVVLLRGAGQMAEGTAIALQSAGVASVTVANRTTSHAEELASKVGAAAVPLEDFGVALVGADVLLTSTGATEPVLIADDLEMLSRLREGRPLLIVDLAVPRDVDPAASEVEGVELLDMADIGAFVQRGLDDRRGEVEAVQEIVGAEVDRYRSQSSARGVAPLVSGLRTHADEIRVAELSRFANRLDGLDAEQLEAVEALTKGIVAKLLHQPTVEVKDAAGTARGDRLAESLRALFDL